jgi:hypothetical protein
MGPKRSNKKGKGKGKGKANNNNHNAVKNGAANPRTPRKASTNGNGSSGGKSLYSRYKAATQSFRDGLEDLLPPSVRLISISDLGSATELLLEESKNASSSVDEAKREKMTVPYVRGELLANLNESIKLREAVAGDFQDDADDGHAYMIGMLHYCRYVLRSCRKKQLATFAALKRSSSKTAATTDDDGLGVGQFDALGVDGEDSEPDDEEEELNAAPIVRPTAPVDREYLIQRDLIDGSYQWQARSYIFQVKTLFDMVDQNFKRLKDDIRQIKQDFADDRKGADTAMVLSTMRAAAASNMAIQEIRYLEGTLKIDSPQFKTFYHILAILQFATQVDQLNGMVDPKVFAADPSISIDFVAKEIECGFRTPLDPQYFEMAPRIDNFMRRGKIAKDPHMPIIATISHIVKSVTFVEVESEFLRNMPHENIQEVRLSCQEVLNASNLTVDLVHVMFQTVWGGSTSGANSILHTHSFLQSTTKLLGSLTTKRRFAAATPMGPLWNAERNKAVGTADACMDDLFFRIIFPEWVSKVQDGTYKYIAKGMLPKIFPWFQEFIDCYERGDQAIPLSSSFAVHTMLTGIVCLQGDGDILRIALASKNASKTFFGQIWGVFDSEHAALKKDDDELRQRFHHKMSTLEMVSRPIYDVPMTTELHSFWNPLAAGSFLLNLSLAESVFPGAAMLDRQHQAVTSLHLYHALRERNIVDEIPALSYIDSILQDSKAIWGVEKPSKGSFVKNFFIGVGHSLSASAKAADFVRDAPYSITKSMFDISEDKKVDIEKSLATEIQNLNLDDGPFIRYQIMYGFRGTLKRGIRKEERPVTPEEISLCYRYFINRDFAGDVEDVGLGKTVNAMSEGGMQTTLGNYLNQSNKLVEQMVSEGRTLSINFLRLTVLMNEFMSKICSHMDWDEDMDNGCSGFLSEWKCSEDYKRQDLLLTFIGDRIFAELDGEPDEAKCEESKKIASLLQAFYGDEKSFDPHFF